MGEIKTFTLPSGTALRGDRIGALTRSEVVVVCSAEDEYLVRAALRLPDAGFIDKALGEKEMKRRTATSLALPAGSSSDHPARPNSSPGSSMQ